MSVDDNKAVILRYFDILNEGTHEYHRVVHPDVTGSDGEEPLRGIESFVRVGQAFRAAVPDLRFAVDQILAEGEWVAVLVTATGTPQAPLWGVPPAGKTFRITAQAMYRVERGLIRQVISVWDTLSLLQQIGAGQTLPTLVRTAP